MFLIFLPVAAAISSTLSTAVLARSCTLVPRPGSLACLDRPCVFTPRLRFLAIALSSICFRLASIWFLLFVPKELFILSPYTYTRASSVPYYSECSFGVPRYKTFYDAHHA